MVLGVLLDTDLDSLRVTCGEVVDGVGFESSLSALEELLGGDALGSITELLDDDLDFVGELIDGDLGFTHSD